jgi:hypothetical protein
MVRGEIIQKDDIGYLIWKLEHITDFYPCYQHMVKSLSEENVEYFSMKKEK